MKTNKEFYRSLHGAAARFYLADLHVHTPASYDIVQRQRFAALPEHCRLALQDVARESLGPAERERKVLQAYPPAKFFQDIKKARDQVAEANGIGEGLDWAFIGLTDHNVCSYSCEVSRIAWTERSTDKIHVLPGIELDVRYPVEGGGEAIAHVLCLFQPCSSESDIRVAIHDACGGGWTLGTELVTQNLPGFIHALRNHQVYPGICIAAHVSTQKGIGKETKLTILSRLDAEIVRVQQELEHGAGPDREALEKQLDDLKTQRTADEISMQSLRLVGACGFDALQIRSHKDDVHYRYLHRYNPAFGRAAPIIASDAHCVDEIFRCDHGIPYLKLTSASSQASQSGVFEDLRNSLRLGETRFSFVTPGTVQLWISGLDVTPDSSDAVRFWPCSTNGDSEQSFCLPLSRNLNALIGGRGSGKSAAIEALSFLCSPGDCDNIDPKTPPDWYKRAEATLAGCNVRVCFQLVGVNGETNLPKKALFVRRHFPISEGHEPVHFSDLNDRELVGNQIPVLPVQIFRLGEIEKHAGAPQLRALFDGICGPDIQEIEEEITRLKIELGNQRARMVEIAGSLDALTSTDASLRDYMRRWKLFYDVNRPEVKKAYERIDQLEDAQRTAISAKSDWKEIEEKIDLENWLYGVRSFFAEYRSASIAENGRARPDHEELLEIVGTDNLLAERTDDRLSRIVEMARGLGSQLMSIRSDLATYLENIENDVREARDALHQQGLPSGAKDREAKKNAFDSAQEALTYYRSLLEQWNGEEAKRQQDVAELQKLGQKRSELRDKTAELITERLRRDLNSDVLLIEAKARSQSDKREFRNWLDRYLTDGSFRYREKRITSLLDRGLTPRSLKTLFSDSSPVDFSVLEIRGSASQGGIDSTTAQSLWKKCAAMCRIPPEQPESEAGGPLWNECPQEIRDGLLTMCRTSSGDMCVDCVLQLDEILFDDEPVILLNDRPQDPDSILRPLEELSPGQRCSAILPIVLLTGNGPLIIDQPEDNLDNRLVRQVIVNILASIKLRRQIIVATHNPNVPVLGDVENAIVLRGVKDRECVVDVTGDLDAGPVVHHLTQVMEGGREAFQYRQTIYQLHWAESVAQDEVASS